MTDPDGFVTQYASHYQIFGPDGALDVLHSPFRNEITVQGEYRYLKHCDEIPHGSAIERVSGLVLRGYTGNQLLRDIDAASMSHSLEVRVPYLDPVIADLALSLPDSAKLGDPDRISATSPVTYRSSGAKRILIDVGRDLLPKDFDLQPKRGFGMPFDTWLRGPLNAAFEDAISPDSIRERGWFDERRVAEIKSRFYQKRTGWPQPWLLMMIELWSREVLDPCLDIWETR
jgi:asparagine synthase (glutamine-hydrolysing)